jgi:Tol biopolymer transport system component
MFRIFLALLTAVFILHSNAFAQKSNKHPYASDAAMPQPVMFGEGIVSTTEDDLNAAFSPDGNTVYFTRNFPGSRLGVILFSEYKKGKWTQPNIAPFSGQATDYDPFFSADGSKIFYCSNRGADGKAKQDYDIWYVEKTGNGWSAPKSAGANVNSASNEFYPSIASDGTLYFSSNKTGGKGSYDVYRARWENNQFAAAENLGDGVNTATTELDNYISPDQKFIVFAANSRKDDLGNGSGDLYISLNENGIFTPAKNLGAPINSPQREYCPIGSPDGKYFFFTSFRSNLDKPLEKPLKNYNELMSLFNNPMNGRGNVFQIDISALGVK